MGTIKLDGRVGIVMPPYKLFAVVYSRESPKMGSDRKSYF
jgi:hypothetical protein